MYQKKNTILVIDLTFYPATDANTICALRILKRLPDFNITVVSEKRHEDETEYEEYEYMSIYRINAHSFRQDMQSIKSLKDAAALAVRSASYIDAKIKRKWNYNDINFDRINNYLWEINHVIDIEKFDIIVSFANPIESHYCASKLSKKYKKPWIAYYFDPYYCNVSKSEKGLKRRIHLERRMLAGANKVIVPEFFLKEMMLDNIILDKNRLKQIALPGIRRIEGKEGDFKALSLNRKRINCVFVGNLYWEIRNPIQAMHAFGQLDDMALYFIGGCFDGDIVEILKQNNISIPSNVFFLGRVQPEKAEEYLSQADILVNIGNTVTNQLPSKIFDYISMGKPIVNICKRKECPSIKYFSRYPLAISIYEEDLKKTEYVKKLHDFCIINKNKQLEYSDLKGLYQEMTVEYVRKEFIGQVESTLRNS